MKNCSGQACRAMPLPCLQFGSVLHSGLPSTWRYSLTVLVVMDALLVHALGATCTPEIIIIFFF